MKLDHFLQHTWHYLTTDGGWKTLYYMYICVGMLTSIGTSGLTLLVRSIGAVVFAVAELSRTDAECRAGTLEVWAAAGRRRLQGGAGNKVTSRDCVCVQTGERDESMRGNINVLEELTGGSTLSRSNAHRRCRSHPRPSRRHSRAGRRTPESWRRSAGHPGSGNHLLKMNEWVS